MPKKGETHTAETIAKIKASRKGQPAWNVGKKWPDIQKVIIGVGRKGIFKWLNDERLKKLITRDYATAKECEEHGLIKPAILLYSGVIEALLRFALQKDVKITFEQLINDAFAKKIIQKHHRDKLNVIRDYRNYVHIHKELENRFELTEGLAQLSRETCDSVIEELNSRVMRTEYSDENLKKTK